MKKRDQILHFFAAAKLADPDACVPWPFCRSGGGYGQTWLSGRAEGAHVRMCRDVYGKPAQKGLVAAHSCGVRICVNPHHLRWATYGENNEDAKEHGTALMGDRHPLSKLSTDDVREIKRLRGKVSQLALAIRFGVSQVKISQIHLGKSWAHINDF